MITAKEARKRVNKAQEKRNKKLDKIQERYIYYSLSIVKKEIKKSISCGKKEYSFSLNNNFMDYMYFKYVRETTFEKVYELIKKHYTDLGYTVLTTCNAPHISSFTISLE